MTFSQNNVSQSMLYLKDLFVNSLYSLSPKAKLRLINKQCIGYCIKP